MVWAATAIVGSAVVSGAMGNKAAGKAADASNSATQASIAEQRRQFDLVRGDTNPARFYGENAMSALAQELGLPAYKAPNSKDNNQTQPRTINQNRSSKSLKVGAKENSGADNYIGIPRGPNGDPKFEMGGSGQTIEGEVLPRFDPATGPLPKFNDTSRLSKFAPDTNLENFNNETQLPSFQDGSRFNFDPSKIAENPNYQFVMDQALKGTNRAMAAQGKLGSGNRLIELAKVAGGIASGEVDKEFGRQYTASGENYGRGIGEFGIKRQGELDKYNINRDVYDTNRTTELAKYDMSSGVFDRNQQTDLAQFGIDENVYNKDYQLNQDSYGRELGEYGVNYQRNQDLYGRGQDRLNRLAALAGAGQTATGQSATAGSNMANAVGNTQMNNAANQGNAAATKYGSINNAVQGGVSNYLAYNQNNRLMDLYGKTAGG